MYMVLLCFAVWWIYEHLHIIQSPILCRVVSLALGQSYWLSQFQWSNSYEWDVKSPHNKTKHNKTWIMCMIHEIYIVCCLPKQNIRLHVYMGWLVILTVPLKFIWHSCNGTNMGMVSQRSIRDTMLIAIMALKGLKDPLVALAQTSWSYREGLGGDSVSGWKIVSFTFKCTGHVRLLWMLIAWCL